MLRQLKEPGVFEVQLAGKMTRDDHESLVSEIERQIQQHRKIRLLVLLHDFHGWRLAALWQDIRFDAGHFKHLERIAVVGDNRWQEWMATLCLPFTTGEVRFFNQDEIEAARAWLQEN